MCLPTQNIGPIFTFLPTGEVEVLFTAIPKNKTGGGVYVEPECLYFPVRIGPGETFRLKGVAELTEHQKVLSVIVKYDSTEAILRRYNFDQVKLHMKAACDGPTK